MVREMVTVQVGQCGNQIGHCFWDLVLREHAAASAAQGGLFDAPMSTYFRNVNALTGAELDTRDGPISCLKARAVLIDTEEGVLSRIMSGPLSELFDDHEFVRGVSGTSCRLLRGLECHAMLCGLC